jgi:PadR family transcriptional regulator PadR
MILLCLAKKEYYGYDLIRSIKRMANLDISEGTIYPLLDRLKDQLLISSRWIEREGGIPRKYYQITRKRRSVLERMKSSWIEFDSALRELMEERP